MKSTEKMIVRSTERSTEGDLVHIGESVVVGCDVSDLKLEVTRKFRSLSASRTDKSPDVWGSVMLEDDLGSYIGEVSHVGYAQNGGMTVYEIIEVIPNQQWKRGRVVFQQYPR